MIRFHELKVGDYVLAEFEGQRSEGEVIGLNEGDKMACIQTSVQDFWFTPDQLYPILLNDSQLMQLGFEKEVYENGIKYKRGPFRILLSEPGNFSHFEMWYREDRRHITQSMYVHELQNHYRQMTKVELVRPQGIQAS
ncbi:MAG: hypothetical protein J0H74_08615 [Chitinophagaceae bacterium]|nr:hypothetical protein [Chitinophagaceae bacterium]